MRRRVLAQLGRWLLLALAGLVGLVGVGLLYQTVATAIDRQRFAPDGFLVDVGGYEMLIHCTGSGSPTVVLEAGAGAPSSIWAWVQPAVAQQTRVCSYDRAGLGWSDTGTQPRDATSVAQELHTLLLRAGETGPFVLAGHSLGGQYALMFAELYAEDTAGLVLIDAQHPDTLFRTPAAQDAARQQQRQVTMLVVLSRLGIVRLFDMAPADERLPAASQAAMNLAVDWTDLVTALRAELLAIPTNREQLQAGGDSGRPAPQSGQRYRPRDEPRARVLHTRSPARVGRTVDQQPPRHRRRRRSHVPRHRSDRRTADGCSDQRRARPGSRPQVGDRLRRRPNRSRAIWDEAPAGALTEGGDVFSGLSDVRKAGIFTVLVLVMATAAALFIRVMRMPAGPITAAIYMFVPAVATMIMLLVVTREGYSKAGWKSLGLHRAGLKVWWIAVLAPLLVGVVGTAIVWATPLASFVAPPALGGVMISLLIQVGVYTVTYSLGRSWAGGGISCPTSSSWVVVEPLCLSVWCGLRGICR